MYKIPNRIFVGGIPKDASQVELKEYFSHFGHVKDARIITDPRGISKGFGFVTYENENDATRALSVGEDELMFKENKLNIGHAFRKKTPMGGNGVGGGSVGGMFGGSPFGGASNHRSFNAMSSLGGGGGGGGAGAHSGFHNSHQQQPHHHQNQQQQYYQQQQQHNNYPNQNYLDTHQMYQQPQHHQQQHHYSAGTGALNNGAAASMNSMNM